MERRRAPGSLARERIDSDGMKIVGRVFGGFAGAAVLRLFGADMAEDGAFDEAVAGTDCVFIACSIPTYVGASGTPAKEMDDELGYEEIIMPTVKGRLTIMRAAIRQGLKNVVICSSTSSTNPVPPVPVKNEIDHWSDEAQQCRAKKYTSATKTVMENAPITPGPA